jgi:hypothetical protein
MFHQTLRNRTPHGVQHKVDTLTPSQLGCGHKISIASDQHYLIHLLLENQQLLAA